MFDDDRLYFTDDLALLVLGRPSTLVHWRCEGRGPAFIKLGSRVAYRGLDVNQWDGSSDGQADRWPPGERVKQLRRRWTKLQMIEVHSSRGRGDP